MIDMPKNVELSIQFYLSILLFCFYRRNTNTVLAAKGQHKLFFFFRFCFVLLWLVFCFHKGLRFKIVHQVKLVVYLYNFALKRPKLNRYLPQRI